MPRPFIALTIAFGMLQMAPALAHEFWIEPENTTAAHVRVGQMLVGEELPFLDRIIRVARHFGPHGTTELKGRQGDLPALSVDLSADGLHVLTVETEPAYIVFDSLPEFGDYLAYEGLKAVVAQHQSRSLPTSEIAEEYLRYAKSLVQVAAPSAADADAPVGMRYELVALDSPFDAKDGKIGVQLLWEEAAEPGAQIAVFHKSSSKGATVTRQLLRTDDNGEVSANVAEPGLYVFNVVHMLPAEGPGSVVWQSHWASLSFTVADD